MSDKADYILIFSASEEMVSPPETLRGLGQAMKSVATKASEVAVNTLQENMRHFLSSLDVIISASLKNVGGLMLDEVEIYAQIDGKGNVGIVGTMGAEFATQGGIKFVLRKKI